VARKKEDRAKAKAQREKKIAIGGAVLLVILLAVEGPKTLKMLHSKPNAPVVSATSTTPSTTPGSTTPTSAAAPTPSGSVASAVGSSSSNQLVSAVQPTVDQGQLSEFSRFASKDPFAVQVRPGGGSSTSTSPPPTTTTPTGTTPTTPPAPAPTSAVISVNGELGSVSVGADFPSSGGVFSRFGAIFHLVALTQTTAKISVVGGSYADGAPTVTLRVGKPVTLQNTADGTRYTLVLEPQGTQVPAAGSTPTFGTPSSTTTPTTAPTSTTATAP
jgi:hypothetical protein